MRQGALTRSGKTCARTGRRFPGGKRIFAAILALTMALCLLPKTAHAAAPYVQIQGVWLTEANPCWKNEGTTAIPYTADYNVYLDVTTTTPTLTLRNCEVHAPAVSAQTSENSTSAGIYVSRSVNIVLIGTNTVTGPDGSGTTNYYSYGLYFKDSAASVVFSGGGTLRATGGNDPHLSGSYGVSVDGAMTVTDGCTINARGGSSESSHSTGIGATDITVSGGTLTATTPDFAAGTSTDTRAVRFSNSILVTSGTLTATAGQGETSYGIYSDNGSGTITVSGGTLSATAGSSHTSTTGEFVHNAGVYTENGDISVTGGSLTGRAGEVQVRTQGNIGCGVYTKNGDISVSGGSLTGTGCSDAINESGVNSYGVCAEKGDISVTGGALSGSSDNNDYNGCGVSAKYGAISVSGGTLTGTAASGTYDNIGVEGDSVTVSNTGTLTGTGGDSVAGNKSMGVVVDGDVTVSDSGTLTGTAGSGSGGSSGLEIGRSLSITGGCVTGIGGESLNVSSIGVAARGVTVSGGSLTGAGGTARGLSMGVYGIQGVTVSGGSLTGTASSSSLTSYGVRTDSAGIVFTGGSTLATGKTSAVNKQPVFADTTQTDPYWYKWKENTTDDTDPGGDYTISRYGGLQFSNWNSAKYLDIRRGQYTPVITTQPADQTVTAGQTATFTVVANGDPAPTYLWEYNDGTSSVWTEMSAETSDHYSVVASTHNDGYRYRCIVSNSKGSVTSDPATLTIGAYTGISVTTSPAAAFVQGNASETAVTINASGVPGFNATTNYDGIDSSSDIHPRLGTVGAPGADGKVENGSIKLTLKQSYLDTLAPGTYTLRIKLKGDPALPAYAQTNIVVSAADVPKTGDGSMPGLWTGLALLAGVGLVVLRKRRA